MLVGGSGTTSALWNSSASISLPTIVGEWPGPESPRITPQPFPSDPVKLNPNQQATVAGMYLSPVGAGVSRLALNIPQGWGIHAYDGTHFRFLVSDGTTTWIFEPRDLAFELTLAAHGTAVDGDALRVDADAPISIQLQVDRRNGQGWGVDVIPATTLSANLSTLQDGRFVPGAGATLAIPAFYHGSMPNAAAPAAAPTAPQKPVEGQPEGGVSEPGPQEIASDPTPGTTGTEPEPAPDTVPPDSEPEPQHMDHHETPVGVDGITPGPSAGTDAPDLALDAISSAPEQVDAEHGGEAAREPEDEGTHKPEPSATDGDRQPDHEPRTDGTDETDTLEVT